MDIHRKEHLHVVLQRIASVSAALCVLFSAEPSEALLASPKAQVPRTVDAALRRSIPAVNEDVRKIQQKLEQVQFRLRIPQRKPWGAMVEDVADAARRASNAESVLSGVLPQDMDDAEALLTGIRADLDRLVASVELKDPDRTSIRVANALERVAQLELLQAPGLPYRLPAQYASLPRLTGRAVVELVVENANGTAAFVKPDSDEGPQKRAVLRLILDGYSAPLTAGNFAKNVIDGFYDNTRLSVNGISVMAEPVASANDRGTGLLPLEEMMAGDFEPVYRTPLDVRSGEIPVLPLSIYGSVAMARQPGNDAQPGMVSSSGFFIYKFERQQSGLAGLSFDEGDFGVFGYISDGAALLSKIEDGDTIVKARLIQGAQKLVVPGSN